MTLRERFDAMFSGRASDCLLWAGDLTYWHYAHELLGDIPPAWRGEAGRDRMHRDLGVGEYIPGARAYRCSEGPRVRTEVEEDHGTRSHRWHTPVGTLTEKTVFSDLSFSWGIVEHAVKEVDDLKVLRYLMENRAYTPTPEAAAKVDADYGDMGIPVLAVPGSPITELNKTWSGVMTLAYLLADDENEVGKTLQAIEESQERIMALTARDPCRYIMVCENLSGDTMGGYFEDHMRDYLTRHTDALHAVGKKVMIHIDGTLRGVLDKIAVTGIDAVDSVTPQPVGDVAVEDLRRMAGPDILLIGGVPGAMFAPPFTWADMERHVRKTVESQKDTGKFILGVADQVPPDGDIDMVKRIADLVETIGVRGG